MRNSRRRKKKLELVQQAAEEELAEINLEQQMLQELNLKTRSRGQPAPARPSPVIQPRAGPGKTVSPQPGILKVPAQNQSTKKKSGISLDLSAMIDALEVTYIFIQYGSHGDEIYIQSLFVGAFFHNVEMFL